MNEPYVKINTFSRTPSIAQILSYLLILLQSCIIYIMIIPRFISESTKIVFIVLYSVSLAALVFTTFLCSWIDPSDEVMVDCKNGNCGKYSGRLE